MGNRWADSILSSSSSSGSRSLITGNRPGKLLVYLVKCSLASAKTGSLASRLMVWPVNWLSNC